jgi:SAM-dependent methyltransferase
MKHDKIIDTVSKYYGQKVRSFGPTPAGVDWNSMESQTLRFNELSKLFADEKNSFSLLDYGCGYGALLEYLNNRKIKVNYTGYDISREMIECAVAKMKSNEETVWTSDREELSRYDYVVASGVFNVKAETSIEEWEEYIYDSLDHINSLSVKGFVFNILSDYSEGQKRKGNLYYANAENLFRYCKQSFSREVALLHDYPLYEFTLIVRKKIQ